MPSAGEVLFQSSAAAWPDKSALYPLFQCLPDGARLWHEALVTTRYDLLLRSCDCGGTWTNV